MKAGWTTTPFGEVCRDVSSESGKVSKADWQPKGSLPIIDQGDSTIAGYTDDTSYAYRGELPVIVFGDHTRRFKYVDQPFTVGAEGVKLLAPAPMIDPRYLFHFLSGVKIPSAGYSRHFKFLKKVAVPVPPLPEQRRIARALDQAFRIRDQHTEYSAKLSSLFEAAFVDIFGDPFTNPRRFGNGRIGDIVAATNYGSSQKAGPTGHYPILRMGNVTEDGRIDLSDLKYVDLPDEHAARYLVQNGDILFNRTNSAELVGKTAVFRGPEPMAYAGYLIRIRMANGRRPDYLAGFLNSGYGKAVLRHMAKSIIGMANINAQELRSIRLPLPPADLELQFEKAIVAVRHHEARLRLRFQRLDALFASLQDRAFKGDL